MKDNEDGIRLRYFETLMAIDTEFDFFLLPGFNLTVGSEMKEFGSYKHGGVGGYEYNCVWHQVTPLDPMGEYEESVSVRGVPHGWDINEAHEKTSKAELLDRYDEYEEIEDARLLEPPYKDHIIVLKNKANEKGDSDFMAFIDPTHRVDGDGQRAGLSSHFSPVRYAADAKYEVPTDELAVSIFIKLVEPTGSQ